VRASLGRSGGALLAVATVVVAGCGGHGSSSGGSKSVALVPWADGVPAQLRSDDAGSAAPCRASQLRAEGKGFVFTPSLDGGTGTATLRNAGSRPCRLTGRPVVRFVGAPQAPQQRQVSLPPRAAAFPSVVPPDATLGALSPGSAAVVSIDWSNWCVPGAAGSRKRLRPPRAVRMTLPSHTGSLEIAYNAVAPCNAPGEPSTIGVRPFQPAPLPTTQPWTSVPVHAAIRSLAGDPPPLHARRGAGLRFAVQLRNTSRTETVRFDRCPIVVEALAPAGAPEAHALNCRGAKPIAPGGSLTFEMRLRVPPRAPLGPNGLFWELDPVGAQGPEVVSRVIVDG
jgi:hypothetical protein